MGPRERAPRCRPHHPHRASLNHRVALPGQPARRARQPPDRRPPDAARIRSRGRPEDVSGSDSSRAAAVAGSEAVHRRHARGRGLDGPRQHRTVQPLARRLVRQHRAHWPQLPAFAERRAADSLVGSQLRLLQAHGRGVHRRREGTGLLRRHRHHDPRPVQDTWPSRARRGRSVVAADRRGGAGSDGKVRRPRSVGHRADARAWPGRLPPGGGEAAGRSRRRAHPRSQD